jgi:hypothetical protein
MKKLFVNLFFLTISTLCFSQPTFTEKTLTDMRQRMLTDWDNYFKNEVSPDYVMQGHVGQTCDVACIAELNKNATLLEWPMEQVKIKQIGNVAIVTGITHHVALFKKSNTKVKNNQRFTETYEYKNGKWMWLSAQFTDIQPSKTEEEAAVQKVIEDEGHEFHFNTDRNSFLSFWNMTDATRMVYSGKTGLVKLTAKDMKDAAEKGIIPKADNQKSTFSNYTIRVNGNISWVTNDQTDSKGILYHEVRCLEKIGNTWKIVSSSVHDTDR